MTQECGKSQIWYTREGEPISYEEWLKLAEAGSSVGTTIINDFKISTIFLGVNHRAFGDQPPLIYETMCFFEGKKKKLSKLERLMHNYMHRTSTLSDARKTHEIVCAMLQIMIMATATAE